MVASKSSLFKTEFKLSVIFFHTQTKSKLLRNWQQFDFALFSSTASPLSGNQASNNIKPQKKEYTLFLFGAQGLRNYFWTD